VKLHPSNLRIHRKYCFEVRLSVRGSNLTTTPWTLNRTLGSGSGICWTWTWTSRSVRFGSGSNLNSEPNFDNTSSHVLENQVAWIFSNYAKRWWLTCLFPDEQNQNRLSSRVVASSCSFGIPCSAHLWRLMAMYRFPARQESSHVTGPRMWRSVKIQPFLSSRGSSNEPDRYCMLPFFVHYMQSKVSTKYCTIWPVV